MLLGVSTAETLVGRFLMSCLDFIFLMTAWGTLRFSLVTNKQESLGEASWKSFS